ncbi:MAG TPA: CapA family protein [Candidatus Aquilonibacter sp.]|nr:CapA family protein [Candidatus Aquilonibacter sp.]
MSVAAEESTRLETRAVLTVWRRDESTAIAARVAIAGDFLPAGDIHLAAGMSWREAAAPILPHLSDVDVTLANLECPIDVRELCARPLNGIGQIVRADAESLHYLRGIRCASVGVANNHAYDFGTPGVEFTRAALIRAGFVPLGAGQTLNELPEVSRWRGPGALCVGFWAAASAAGELANHGTEGVEPATVQRAEQAVARMKESGVNFSVGLIHAGCIRCSRPAPEDVSLIRRLAKCGFNLVACSHSHRIAGYEAISQQTGENPAFCFYGLGSIASGYIASDLEREGLIVVAGFDRAGHLAEVSVRPVYLPHSGIGEAASPQKAEEILARFELLSAEISGGSYEDQFYKEISRGLLRLYWRDVRAAIHQSGIRGLARKAARVRLCHVKRLMHRVRAT